MCTLFIPRNQILLHLSPKSASNSESVLNSKIAYFRTRDRTCLGTVQERTTKELRPLTRNQSPATMIGAKIQELVSRQRTHFQERTML